MKRSVLIYFRRGAYIHLQENTGFKNMESRLYLGY